MNPKNIDNWPAAVRENLLSRTRALISEAFQEDVNGAGDVTSRAIFSSDERGSARIFAKEDGVIAGLFVAEEAFRHANRALEMDSAVADGQTVAKGETVLRGAGPAGSLRGGARTAPSSAR